MSAPVLLIDSDNSSTEKLCQKLQDNWSVDIHCAASYEEAKECLKKYRHQYLVAICELRFPDAIEYEILNLLEKAGVKCVALTSIADKKYSEILSKPNLIDLVTKDTSNAFNYVAGLVGRLYKNKYYKVLIVEDSATASIILEEMLNLLNFQVLMAKNGREAMDILQENPDIRLAITDYEMPEMNGFQFTVTARKTLGKEQLAIIGLSASGQSDLGSMFIKNGANDFLFKPYSFAELLCRINTNIEALEHLDFIYELANKDSLTKLFNRRYFFGSGNQKYDENSATNADFTVAMFDIDFFKKVNDTYGHDGGDAVLIHFANLMKEHFAAHLIGRLGGEEFAIIMENLSESEVTNLLESFREKVEASHIDWNDQQIKITVSSGAMSKYNGSLDTMLKKADENLYLAKKVGRNTVILS